MRLRSVRGFTLMEILVVVFIIGLLTTLVAPRLWQESIKAKRTKAAADIKLISEALQRYQLEHGSFPTADQGLELLARRDGGSTYLERVPLDPWGMPYLYRSDGKDFEVMSFANDRQEGGTDLDADLRSSEF